MTFHALQHLFRPASIAVIGASDQAGSVGSTIMHNLLASAFAGAIVPVNRDCQTVAGIPVVPDVPALPLTPELAVVCAPAQAVPEIIGQLGIKGTKAALVLTAGRDGQETDQGRTLTHLMLQQARRYALRIIGPNSVGMLLPGIGLNASYAYPGARRGKLAFVCQSGKRTMALLDWATRRDIGFSHFICLGDAADVDFGDMLDYLATDADAHAILLYIESVAHARRLMAGARAAARSKKLIVTVNAGPPRGTARASVETYGEASCRMALLRLNAMLERCGSAHTLTVLRRSQGNHRPLLPEVGASV